MEEDGGSRRGRCERRLFIVSRLRLRLRGFGLFTPFGPIGGIGFRGSYFTPVITWHIYIDGVILSGMCHVPLWNVVYLDFIFVFGTSLIPLLSSVWSTVCTILPYINTDTPYSTHCTIPYTPSHVGSGCHGNHLGATPKIAGSRRSADFPGFCFPRGFAFALTVVHSLAQLVLCLRSPED